MDNLDATSESENIVSRSAGRFNQTIQIILDKITPYHVARWILVIGLLVLFMYRVVHLEGFYIIAYILGIFLLNQLILFLTPMTHFLENDYDFEADDDTPRLPTRSDEEFRPFMRRLPEFKFWYTTFKSIIISILCTFFEIFDIPVFWPILVMYFITLFIVTMRRQIQHMIKHRYVPFSYGKVRYQGKNDNNKNNQFRNK